MHALQRGESFDTRGYDEVAAITVFNGGGRYIEFIVLNNNSSHYIVAKRISRDDSTAVFVSSYRYHSDHDVLAMYEAALMLAMALAKQN